MGTAGRGPDFSKMSKMIYGKMFKKAKDIIKDEFMLKLDSVELVSGGAAWAGTLIMCKLLEMNHVRHTPPIFLNILHTRF